MTQLFHLSYISKSELTGSREDIRRQVERIVEQAQQNNAAIGVTGALYYTDPYFCQVIEGERARVDALFEKIAQDPRHSAVTVMEHEAIEARAFTDWAMRNLYHPLNDSWDAARTEGVFGAVAAEQLQEIVQFNQDSAASA